MPRPSRPATALVMARDVFREQFGAPQLARLRAVTGSDEVVVLDELDSPAARAALGRAEVLLTSWGAPRLTAERLAAAPRLRAVLHAAGSVRGLVSEAVYERDLLVTTAATENARPVAEFTLATLVLVGKKVPFLAADARRFRDDWSYRAARGELTNRGRTIGVVGFSRIGRLVVAGLAHLETAAVLVHDPLADAAEVAAAGAALVGLDELLRRSDVVTLHAPSLPETRQMIGARELALMPDGATLVNTARGALVDTAALERECASGRLDAVLDVTDPEPLPASSVLYDLPNVVLTPHVAGSMGSETRRMSDRALDELERYAQGRPPLEPVSRSVLAVSA